MKNKKLIGHHIFKIEYFNEKKGQFIFVDFYFDVPTSLSLVIKELYEIYPKAFKIELNLPDD
jgi:hypothetical protein